MVLAVLAGFKKNDPTTKVKSSAKEYMVLGSNGGTIQLERIQNPMPTIDTVRNTFNDSTFLVVENYGFDFYSQFDALQVTRLYGYQVNMVSDRQYINSITIQCQQALVAQTDESYTISRSVNRDTVYGLSNYSPFSSLTNIEEVIHSSNFYPAVFSEGDTIDLTHGKVAWVSAQSISNSFSKGLLLHHHRQTSDYHYSSTDSIFKYRLYDLYYPKWKGITEKYFVFSSSLDMENPKAGWVKVTVGLDGSLIVHEVAYQVD